MMHLVVRLLADVCKAAPGAAFLPSLPVLGGQDAAGPRQVHAVLWSGPRGWVRAVSVSVSFVGVREGPPPVTGGRHAGRMAIGGPWRTVFRRTEKRTVTSPEDWDFTLSAEVHAAKFSPVVRSAVSPRCGRV